MEGDRLTVEVLTRLAQKYPNAKYELNWENPWHRQGR